MSPRLQPLEGGCREEDRHEQRRVATSGSVRTSSQRVVAFGGCGGDFAAELPASEAALAALSPGRSWQHAAWQRGAALPSCQAGCFPRASAAADSREVFRRPRGTLWADLGIRAFGRRGWPADPRGDLTSLDAGSRSVEPHAREEASASSAAPTQGALWRTGATGRQLSRLVRATRSDRLSDEHGRRRHFQDPEPSGRRRNYLERRQRAALVDRKLRRAAGALYRLEKSLQGGANTEAGTARGSTTDAVRKDVRAAGDSHHRGQLPASQR